MAVQLLRRLAWFPVVLVGVVLAVFVLMRVIPGDPVVLVAGLDAAPETVRMVRAELGLDRPLPVQFGRYVARLVRLDLGRSIRTERRVLDEIAPRLRRTAELSLVALAFAAVTGIALGLVSALRAGSALDTGAALFAALGVSTPSYYLGLLLALLFAVLLRLLPAGGAGELRHLVLPALTLGAASAAVIARITRSSLLQTLGTDYSRTARAKGVSERAIVLKHCLKNAAIPIVTVVGLQLSFMLGGTVFVETIFNYPGVGWLVVESISMRDFPVIQGAVLVVAAIFIAINALTDALYVVLDPRIRA